MQYVNDDMDELFRRAAEDYPLDTTNADWNKVLAALEGHAQQKAVPENKGNKNGRLLWLLLLLPLGLICNQLYSPGAIENQVPKSNAGSSKVTIDVSKVQSVKNSDLTKGKGDIIKNVETGQSRPDNQIANPSVKPSFSTSEKLYSANLTSRGSNGKDYSTNYFTHTSNLQTAAQDNHDLMSDEPGYRRSYVPEILFSHPFADISTQVSRELNPLFNLSEQNSKQPIHVARRKRFYAGVIAGADATTVKFQKIENAGATYGALLGYELNKKWSIEGGILLEKKYYYSEGKYFKTTKIPQNWTVDDVSGNCKMIELPLSIRYNFTAHKNSGWFATAGTSTYFMQKQNYVYDYYWGGWRYTKNMDYDTASTYIFSNIGLSVGYVHRLGNFADLRIEPYVKLPVSGIGIGRLPMLSSGLQIGITKKF